MANDSLTFVKLISDQLLALTKEREDLLAKVDEIDAKMQGIAKQLGVELPAPTSALPRLPHEPQPHPKYVGSMPAAMMDILLHAERGYTRVELKKLVRESEAGEAVKKNENTFYNAVKRYLDKNKIVDIDGLLYHPDRAPQIDEGDMFPPNVTRLRGEGLADG